jgi:hypothetical protein
MSFLHLEARESFKFLLHPCKHGGADTFCRKASRVLENLAAGSIKLSEEELHEINELIKDHDFGHRYYGSDEQAGLWG